MSILFPCLDCGKETTRADWYMIKDELWKQLVPEDTKEERWEKDPTLKIYEHHFLCIQCLEKRAGRKLTLDDFKADVPTTNSYILTLKGVKGDYFLDYRVFPPNEYVKTVVEEFKRV